MKNSEPIIVSTASVTKEKFQAIVNLSEAVKDIAKALSSVTTEVNVSNCKVGGIKIEKAD